MKSEMAEADLQQMMADGLKPTIDDIIRLNALGLKCELSQRSGEYYALPRLAFLGRLSLREPTIGHGIWIDSVIHYCCERDLSTRIAIEAFAISRPLDELPDASDRSACVKAIDDFTKNELAPFTFAQVHCAVTYAMHGNSATALEYPALPEETPEIAEDAAVSVGAGVLVETLAMGLGLSVRDICGMTISKAKRLQEMGLARNGIDISKSNHGTRVAEYYSTRYEIINRLTAEKSAAVKE